MRFLLDNETVEAFDELIALGEMPPAPGNVEEILPQLGIGGFLRAALGIRRTGDAFGDGIAQFLQHQQAPTVWDGFFSGVDAAPVLWRAPGRLGNS